MHHMKKNTENTPNADECTGTLLIAQWKLPEDDEMHLLLPRLTDKWLQSVCECVEARLKDETQHESLWFFELHVLQHSY